MNPFNVNAMPIDTYSALFGRENEIKTLKKHIDERKQTVVLGVEGVGKTSLLRSVFNREYRIQKALDHTLISPVTEFPTGLKNDDIYSHFTEMILSSVRILAQCDRRDEMNDILAACDEERRKNLKPAEFFEKILNVFYDTHGYRIVMIVDDFERFTASTEITKEHHEVLRKLLSKLQYIVASNYDLNQDSLPSDVSGSLYLQAFAGNEISIGGWSHDDAVDYIYSRLNTAEIELSERTVDAIVNVSGGIPAILNLAANYAYDYVANNGAEDGLKFKPLYENNQRMKMLFDHWCKMLLPKHITALTHLIENNYDNEQDRSNLECLLMRGLVKKHSETDAFGHTRSFDDVYEFCCKFFETYCKNESNMISAAEKNPLKSVLKADNCSPNTDELEIGEIVELLKKKIDETDAPKEQLLEIVNQFSAYMPNVTGVIALDEELSDEILSNYLLSRDYLSKFDEKVRDFLFNGIQMDRCFSNITLAGFDYSLVYISFCKAVEVHLNKTLVPIIKAICPNVIYNSVSPISALPSNETLTLGTISYILSKRGIGISDSAIDELKNYCRKNKYTQYPDNWWDSILNSIKKIAASRNNCPHCSILSDSEGKEMLKSLFSGNKNDPGKSFMMKCVAVYGDLMNIPSVC